MIKLKKIVFATITSNSGKDIQAPILVASIRKFGGSLAESPIWVFVPTPEKEVSEKVSELFKSFNVKLIPFYSDKENMKFPFIAFTLAAAKAEELAKEEFELIVWLDHNILIINEPKEFLLEEEKSFAFRPVHHTLIGSIYDQPLDEFWRIIYERLKVEKENIFPMKTHIDGNILRPYINSGFLVVRPEKGILNKWWGSYRELYKDSIFRKFYDKNELYVIFLHQAILSALFITLIKENEFKELPFTYNYPVHLYPESLPQFQPESLNDMVVLRFYLEKLKNPEWLKKIPLYDPLKGWILEEIKSFSLRIASLSKKIKYGQIPLIYPIPIILAGSLVEGKPNFSTLGDVGIIGINPPILYISSEQSHHLNKGILENETFSVNFPQTSLLPEIDYCGIVSGRDVNKAEMFSVFYGELENAPLIKECPVNIECRVIKEFSIQHRQVFIGEVVQVHVSEQYIKEIDGKKRIANMKDLDPIIYALDNRYYRIGDIIGKGYNEYKKLKDDDNT